ncbi:M48 family metallopeptidase [Rheinheimera sp.]|uniref:M48 family metallopeptidase n=1 Tax=Rheinheimera sp. TaxID=1869214 RepID=UPI00307EF073
MRNFFAEQDKARSNTRLLVLLFSVALLLLLLMTNLLLLVTLGLLEPAQYQDLHQWPDGRWLHSLPWSTMGWLSAAICGAVLLAILFKQAALGQGGPAVAQALGGQRLDRALADASQSQLLNVVEEMAIASGVPVPPVYLLPEQGINAFAAGYSPADAVVGVTQGCIEQLSRDELQGVIAHEFSHILNGDMRLNIRLISLLHGIEFIGHSGYFLLRHGGRSRSANSKDSGNALLILGLGLMLLGYLGVFFGSLIKAAVSRQREFLADASAVQFTRNPAGIAGALKRIGLLAEHGRLRHPNAAEMSHLFFADALPRFTRLLATHPPLKERILRLDPQWDGSSINPTASAKPAAAKTPQPKVASVFAALPLVLLSQLRQTAQAPALCCACLLQQPQKDNQLALIARQLGQEFARSVERLLPDVMPLSALHKLQLLQVAVPGLKQLSAAQFRQLSVLCEQLVRHDQQTDLYEWCVISWLQHTVGVQFDAQLLHRNDSCRQFSQIQAQALVLLAACAELAAHQPLQQQSWQAGLQALGLAADRALTVVSLEQLNQALPPLIHAAPAVKQQLWQMLQAAVQADHLVNEQESLLLYVLALLLEIPLSPEQLAALTTAPA